MTDSILPGRLDAGLDRIGLLLDPTRRRVFAHVVSSPGVTRDETARALEIDRALATFHLERLLQAGLVETVAPTPPPDARRARGRPVKRYRARDLGLDLTFPPRDYRLAAELFADAISGIDRPSALDDAARARGEAIGRAARASHPSRGGHRGVESTDRDRIPPRLEAALQDAGYAPEAADDGRICLRNCPFDAIARTHREVICPTNLALLDGALAGAQVPSYRAVLAPAPGRCCVVLEPVEHETASEGVATEP